MAISWHAWVEATSMTPFAMTLHNRLQPAKACICLQICWFACFAFSLFSCVDRLNTPLRVLEDLPQWRASRWLFTLLVVSFTTAQVCLLYMVIASFCYVSLRAFLQDCYIHHGKSALLVSAFVVFRRRFRCIIVFCVFLFLVKHRPVAGAAHPVGLYPLAGVMYTVLGEVHSGWGWSAQWLGSFTLCSGKFTLLCSRSVNYNQWFAAHC